MGSGVIVGPESLGEGDGEGETESLGDGDGDGDALGEGEGEGDALGEGEGSGSGNGGEKLEKSALLIPTGVIVKVCADLSTRSVEFTYIENARPAVGLRKSVGGVKLALPGHRTLWEIWKPAISPRKAPVEGSLPAPK